MCENFGEGPFKDEVLGISRDSGRGSLGVNEDFGRESLGILNISQLKMMDERRKSLFNLSLNDTFGRESLGILNESQIRAMEEVRMSLAPNDPIGRLLDGPAQSDVYCTAEYVRDFLQNIPSKAVSFTFGEKKSEPQSNLEPEALLDESIRFEAKHIASLIADDLEDNYLDRTSEPAELFNILEDDDEPPVIDTESVFKSIDIFHPPPQNKTSTSSESDSKESNNLSEISEKSNRTERKSGWLSLLSSASPQNLNRSLSMNEAPVCEPLDLRMKSSSDSDMSTSTEPLNLSLKTKDHFFRSPQLISKQKSLSSFNSTKSRLSSFSGGESRSLADLSLGGPKKIVSAVKKGPMRAVIPLDSMVKRKSGVVPAAVPTRTSLVGRLKPCSPVSDPKMKPMAQSTPSGGAKKVIKAPRSAPSSPSLVAPRASIARRSSISYASPTSKPIRSQLVRSFSTGKDPTLLSTLSRVREEVALKRKTLEVPLKENLKSTTNTSKTNKSIPRLSFGKKSGKENFK